MQKKTDNYCCRFHHLLPDTPMVTTLGESVHRINVEPAQRRICARKKIRVIAWC